MIKRKCPLHPDSPMARLLRERHLTTRKQQEQEWGNFWIAQDSLSLAIIALSNDNTRSINDQKQLTKQEEQIIRRWATAHNQTYTEALRTIHPQAEQKDTQPPRPANENPHQSEANRGTP